MNTPISSNQNGVQKGKIFSMCKSLWAEVLNPKIPLCFITVAKLFQILANQGDLIVFEKTNKILPFVVNSTIIKL